MGEALSHLVWHSELIMSTGWKVCKTVQVGFLLCSQWWSPSHISLNSARCGICCTLVVGFLTVFRHRVLGGGTLARTSNHTSFVGFSVPVIMK